MSASAPKHLSSIRLTYQRLYRGIDGLLAPWRPLDDRPAASLLPPAGLTLYRRMGKADRAHSLRLLAWLQGRGYSDPNLLVAALLHDCGKAAAPLAVWQRTLKVLLKLLAPATWHRLSRPARPDEWRYPFFVLRTHPDLGAAWAETAGLDPTIVWLIRYHETNPNPSDAHYNLMLALQQADAAS